MRRPTVHEKFGQSRIPGLTELLAGDVAMAAAVHDSGIPNLQLISAGTIPPNPAELLGSKAIPGTSSAAILSGRCRLLLRSWLAPTRTLLMNGSETS